MLVELIQFCKAFGFELHSPMKMTQLKFFEQVLIVYFFLKWILFPLLFHSVKIDWGNYTLIFPGLYTP